MKRTRRIENMNDRLTTTLELDRNAVQATCYLLPRLLGFIEHIVNVPTPASK